jgi:multicomponent Na+:H+ antiporter subunit B
MRAIVAMLVLAVLAVGIFMSLTEIPFGSPPAEVGRHYLEQGMAETGAANIVTSVVVSYRGFDTLGEVTVLFIAAVGLAAVLRIGKKTSVPREPASFVLYTGCLVLFPLILVYGSYVVVHGHLSPGGGFQGGAIIASAFLLSYLGCRERRIGERASAAAESLGGLSFVVLGLVGLALGGHFLLNFLPRGETFTLLSSGIIPLIYIAIGVKVGSELAGIIDNLIEETE